jgi:hypothetical protein
LVECHVANVVVVGSSPIYCSFMEVVAIRDDSVDLEFLRSEAQEYGTIEDAVASRMDVQYQITRTMLDEKRKIYMVTVQFLQEVEMTRRVK